MNLVEKMRKSNKDLLDYAYYDERILPYNEATLGLGSNSLQYGSLIFAGIRGFVQENGDVVIFRLRDHHNRLMNGCKILAYNFHIEYEEFEKIIFDLVKKNDVKEDIYIRAFIFVDSFSIVPKTHNMDFALGVYMMNLQDFYEKTKARKLMTSSFVKVSDNAMSTKAKVAGAYVNSMMAAHQANVLGYDDAILFTENGYVSEATVSNLLISYRDIVATPSLNNSQLEGIMMRSAVNILEHNGIEVQKLNIDRSALYLADEVIQTGTAVKFLKVDEVDGRKLKGDNKILNILDSEFKLVIAGKHPFSEKWLFKVK